MGARIATIQRQARELGRLRTGTYNGRYPERSKTWILTSHARHYIEAAAEIWGGTVEEYQPQGNGAAQWRVITDTETLDAILPPGDPLSQSYEQWSKGGCQRRCDGMSEELSRQPCLCRAEWGEAFHETAPQGEACQITTRLNVMLPDLPDIGAWRVETHSFYSANEIAAAVDMLKGGIGERALIPVKLRIEQRTRVAQGKTKHFPVVAVELRGGTAGQVLAGAAPTIAVNGSGQPAVESNRPELPAGPTRDFVAEIKVAASKDDVLAVWRAAKDAHAPNAVEVEAAARARAAELEPASPPTPRTFMEAAEHAATKQQLTEALAAAQAAGFATNLQDEGDEVAQVFVARLRTLDGATEPATNDVDRDAVWSQIVAAWPGDSITEIEEAFESDYDCALGDATGEQLAAFLVKVKAGAVKPSTNDHSVPF